MMKRYKIALYTYDIDQHLFLDDLYYEYLDILRIRLIKEVYLDYYLENDGPYIFQTILFLIHDVKCKACY